MHVDAPQGASTSPLTVTLRLKGLEKHFWLTLEAHPGGKFFGIEGGKHKLKRGIGRGRVGEGQVFLVLADGAVLPKEILWNLLHLLFPPDTSYFPPHSDGSEGQSQAVHPPWGAWCFWAWEGQVQAQSWGFSRESILPDCAWGLLVHSASPSSFVPVPFSMPPPFHTPLDL